MEAMLVDDVREALGQSADRASGKRDELAALVVEGIRDGFMQLELRRSLRRVHLRQGLITEGIQAFLLPGRRSGVGFIPDHLTSDELELCQNEKLWAGEEPGESSVLMPWELRSQWAADDDGDPFLLSNEPTTKGLAALRLAIIHDATFVDDSILMQAIELTADDRPIQRELRVWHAVYCREDTELRRLFPEGSNPRRIKARLAKWEADVFGEAVDRAADSEKPVDDSPERAASDDGQTDKPKRKHTPKGFGQESCRAAWLGHHEYENGRCYSDTPMASIKALCELTETPSRPAVSYNTAKKFFDTEFEAKNEGGGHGIYQRVCLDRDRLNDFGRKIARDVGIRDIVNGHLVDQYIGESGSARRQIEEGAKLSDNRRIHNHDDGT